MRKNTFFKISMEFKRLVYSNNVADLRRKKNYSDISFCENFWSYGCFFKISCRSEESLPKNLATLTSLGVLNFDSPSLKKTRYESHTFIYDLKSFREKPQQTMDSYFFLLFFFVRIYEHTRELKSLARIFG